MEAVLLLIKRVYFILTHPIHYHNVADGKCGSTADVWTNIKVQCQYLLNFEVRLGKPPDDSMRVKSSEALWFASLHLTSVEANAR